MVLVYPLQVTGCQQQLAGLDLELLATGQVGGSIFMHTVGVTGTGKVVHQCGAVTTTMEATTMKATKSHTEKGGYTCTATAEQVPIKLCLATAVTITIITVRLWNEVTTKGAPFSL